MAKSRFNYNTTGTGAKPSLGKKSFTMPARPGRQNKSPNGAESVMSANGKTPRPGYKEKAPQAAGGRGSIARPGWHQKITG